jgi:hypothetical protein
MAARDLITLGEWESLGRVRVLSVQVRITGGIYAVVTKCT